MNAWINQLTKLTFKMYSVKNLMLIFFFVLHHVVRQRVRNRHNPVRLRFWFFSSMNFVRVTRNCCNQSQFTKIRLFLGKNDQLKLPLTVIFLVLISAATVMMDDLFYSQTPFSLLHFPRMVFDRYQIPSMCKV